MMERFPAAEAAYTQSINLRKNQPLLKLELARTLTNLAILEKDQGRLEEARRHAMQALEMAGSDNAQVTAVASVWNSLGLIALAQNKLSEARNSFDKASALWIQTVGREHPNYATALANMGVVESRQGHHKKAQELLETALRINETRFGPAHPQVASNLTNLAVELFNQKKYEAAVTQFKRAEQIQEQFFGEQSAQVASLWRSIAIANYDSRNLDESQAAFSKAIHCLELASNPDNPELAVWLREYANVLRQRRQFSQAEQAEVEATRIQVRNTIKADRENSRGAS